MEMQSARQFKLHMDNAFRELSSALVLAHTVYAPEEALPIRKSIADVIAAVDAILYDVVYAKHPELNEHARGRKNL